MSAQGPEFQPDRGLGGESPPEVQVVWHEQPPPGMPPPKRALLIAAAALVVAGIVVGMVLGVGQPDRTATGTTPNAASGDPATSAPASTTGASPVGEAPGSAGPTVPSVPTQTGPPDFTSAITTAKSSVVRVFASTCQGTGVGTGFWIDEETVLTSYQSVAKTVSTVVVDEAGQPSVAEVVGADPASGVALLSTEAGPPDSTLTIGPGTLGVGDWVAVVGLRSRRTEVSSKINRIISTGKAFNHRGARITDLAILPGGLDIGLGGAPVVDASGGVAGAVFALPGKPQRLVVPADRLQEGVEAARAAGAPGASGCTQRPTGPGSQTMIAGDAPKAMLKGLKAYFGGINAADDTRAFAAMSPGHGSTPPDWISTFDFNIQVRSARLTSSGGRAWITFDSIQRSDKGPGDQLTCARWSINYSFVPDSGRLEIKRNSAHGGLDEMFLPC